MKQVLNRILFFILVSTFVFLETSTQSVATDFSDYDLVSYRVDENHPPLTYTKNMRLYGFDPDFTNLIFNQMDYKIEMSSGNWTENYEKIQLEDLKNLNVGVGKGYSSLNNLQFLPISTVKIDKSFIDQILRRDEKSLILEEIISIAHKLKMNVIAQGVEEEQQMEKLLQTEERVNLV